MVVGCWCLLGCITTGFEAGTSLGSFWCCVRACMEKARDGLGWSVYLYTWLVGGVWERCENAIDIVLMQL